MKGPYNNPVHNARWQRNRILKRARIDIRYLALKRDGFRCRHCSTRENLTVHHIVPKRHGGPTTVENLLTLCRSCHDIVEGIRK